MMGRSQVPYPLRRARLLAARTRPVWSCNRRAILTGQWDGGDVVRAFLSDSREMPCPASDGEMQ